MQHQSQHARGVHERSRSLAYLERARKAVFGCVALVAAGLAPLFIDPYTLHLLVLTLIYAYLGLAWNVIGGMTGQLSLGHSLYVGLSAYLSTYLFAVFGISPWIGLILGALSSAIIASAIGAACFRYGVKGPFFALATLAFAEVARIVVLNTNALGGANGMIVPLRGNDPLMFQFESRELFYYIALSLTLLAMVVSALIERSRTGYHMRAIRDDEIAAEACGIGSFKTKLTAMAVSAALAGVGGVFFAQYNLYVHPDALFGIPLSIQIVLVVVIGGIGTILGPVVGAILFTTISEISRAYFGEITGIHLAIYGLLLMVVVLAAPNGVVGAVRAALKK